MNHNYNISLSLSVAHHNLSLMCGQRGKNPCRGFPRPGVSENVSQKKQSDALAFLNDDEVVVFVFMRNEIKT